MKVATAAEGVTAIGGLGMPVPTAVKLAVRIRVHRNPVPSMPMSPALRCIRL